jgi:ATP-dependent protease HslVU (ClpYQ) peptidase subunit
MTTIVATRKCMAADTNTCIGDTFYEGAPKIVRVGRVLIGSAGHVSAIDKFVAWFKNRGRKKPEFSKKEDLAVLILSPKGLFFSCKDLTFDEIRSPYFAIGTGAIPALVAMDVMEKLGKKLDATIAIEAACRRDPDNTKGPVLVMNL